VPIIVNPRNISVLPPCWIRAVQHKSQAIVPLVQTIEPVQGLPSLVVQDSLVEVYYQASVPRIIDSEHLTQRNDMIILPGVGIVDREDEGKVSSRAAQCFLEFERLYVGGKTATTVLSFLKKSILVVRVSGWVTVGVGRYKIRIMVRR
jgi:hypothetical protein